MEVDSLLPPCEVLIEFRSETLAVRSLPTEPSHWPLGGGGVHSVFNREG